MNALVSITADGARTSSRIVADAFEKNHRDVLRSIDKMLEIRPDLHVRNFALTSDELSMANGGRRDLRFYEMDRDGFTLLAMGFTGAKALDWKLAFIDAFNRMEAALAEPEGEEPVLAIAADSHDPLGLQDIGPALALVREARQLFGRPAARRLWPRLGLPDVTSRIDIGHGPVLTEKCEMVATWLEERTVAMPGNGIRTTELYADYCRWCEEARQKPHSLTKFGKLLGAAGHPVVRGQQYNYRAGIALKE